MPRKTMFFQNKELNVVAERVCLVETLENIMRNYRYLSAQNSGNQDFLNSTAEDILSIMKENQKRHKTRTAATPSTFNLMTLQNLPKELLDIICQKLNIPEKHYILKEITPSTKSEFADLIRNYQHKPTNPTQGSKII